MSGMAHRRSRFGSQAARDVVDMTSARTTMTIDLTTTGDSTLPLPSLHPPSSRLNHRVSTRDDTPPWTFTRGLSRSSDKAPPAAQDEHHGGERESLDLRGRSDRDGIRVDGAHRDENCVVAATTKGGSRRNVSSKLHGADAANSFGAYSVACDLSAPEEEMVSRAATDIDRNVEVSGGAMTTEDLPHPSELDLEVATPVDLAGTDAWNDGRDHTTTAATSVTLGTAPERSVRRKVPRPTREVDKDCDNFAIVIGSIRRNKAKPSLASSNIRGDDDGKKFDRRRTALGGVAVAPKCRLSKEAGRATHQADDMFAITVGEMGARANVQDNSAKSASSKLRNDDKRTDRPRSAPAETVDNNGKITESKSGQPVNKAKDTVDEDTFSIIVAPTRQVKRTEITPSYSTGERPDNTIPGTECSRVAKPVQYEHQVEQRAKDGKDQEKAFTCTVRARIFHQTCTDRTKPASEAPQVPVTSRVGLSSTTLPSGASARRRESEAKSTATAGEACLPPNEHETAKQQFVPDRTPCDVGQSPSLYETNKHGPSEDRGLGLLQRETRVHVAGEDRLALDRCFEVPERCAGKTANRCDSRKDSASSAIVSSAFTPQEKDSATGRIHPLKRAVVLSAANTTADVLGERTSGTPREAFSVRPPSSGSKGNPNASMTSLDTSLPTCHQQRARAPDRVKLVRPSEALACKRGALVAGNGMLPSNSMTSPAVSADGSPNCASDDPMQSGRFDCYNVDTQVEGEAHPHDDRINSSNGERISNAGGAIFCVNDKTQADAMDVTTGVEGAAVSLAAPGIGGAVRGSVDGSEPAKGSGATVRATTDVSESAEATCTSGDRVLPASDGSGKRPQQAATSPSDNVSIAAAVLADRTAAECTAAKDATSGATRARGPSAEGRVACPGSCKELSAGVNANAAGEAVHTEKVERRGVVKATAAIRTVESDPMVTGNSVVTVDLPCTSSETDAGGDTAAIVPSNNSLKIGVIDKARETNDAALTDTSNATEHDGGRSSQWTSFLFLLVIGPAPTQDKVPPGKKILLTTRDALPAVVTTKVSKPGTYTLYVASSAQWLGSDPPLDQAKQPIEVMRFTVRDDLYQRDDGSVIGSFDCPRCGHRPPHARRIDKEPLQDGCNPLKVRLMPSSDEEGLSFLADLHVHASVPKSCSVYFCGLCHSHHNSRRKDAQGVGQMDDRPPVDTRPESMDPPEDRPDSTPLSGADVERAALPSVSGAHVERAPLASKAIAATVVAAGGSGEGDDSTLAAGDRSEGDAPGFTGTVDYADRGDAKTNTMSSAMEGAACSDTTNASVAGESVCRTDATPLSGADVERAALSSVSGAHVERAPLASKAIAATVVAAGGSGAGDDSAFAAGDRSEGDAPGFAGTMDYADRGDAKTNTMSSAMEGAACSDTTNASVAGESVCRTDATAANQQMKTVATVQAPTAVIVTRHQDNIAHAAKRMPNDGQPHVVSSVRLHPKEGSSASVTMKDAPQQSLSEGAPALTPDSPHDSPSPRVAGTVSLRAALAMEVDETPPTGPLPLETPCVSPTHAAADTVSLRTALAVEARRAPLARPLPSSEIPHFVPAYLVPGTVSLREALAMEVGRSDKRPVQGDSSSAADSAAHAPVKPLPNCGTRSRGLNQTSSTIPTPVTAPNPVASETVTLAAAAKNGNALEASSKIMTDPPLATGATIEDLRRALNLVSNAVEVGAAVGGRNFSDLEPIFAKLESAANLSRSAGTVDEQGAALFQGDFKRLYAKMKACVGAVSDCSVATALELNSSVKDPRGPHAASKPLAEDRSIKGAGYERCAESSACASERRIENGHIVKGTTDAQGSSGESGSPLASPGALHCGEDGSRRPADAAVSASNGGKREDARSDETEVPPAESSFESSTDCPVCGGNSWRREKGGGAPALQGPALRDEHRSAHMLKECQICLLRTHSVVGIAVMPTDTGLARAVTPRADSANASPARSVAAIANRTVVSSSGTASSNSSTTEATTAIVRESEKTATPPSARARQPSTANRMHADRESKDNGGGKASKLGSPIAVTTAAEDEERTSMERSHTGVIVTSGNSGAPGTIGKGRPSLTIGGSDALVGHLDVMMHTALLETSAGEPFIDESGKNKRSRTDSIGDASGRDAVSLSACSEPMARICSVAPVPSDGPTDGTSRECRPLATSTSMESTLIGGRKRRKGTEVAVQSSPVVEQAPELRTLEDIASNAQRSKHVTPVGCDRNNAGARKPAGMAGLAWKATPNHLTLGASVDGDCAAGRGSLSPLEDGRNATMPASITIRPSGTDVHGCSERKVPHAMGPHQAAGKATATCGKGCVSDSETRGNSYENSLESVLRHAASSINTDDESSLKRTEAVASTRAVSHGSIGSPYMQQRVHGNAVVDGVHRSPITRNEPGSSDVRGSLTSHASRDDGQGDLPAAARTAVQGATMEAVPADDPPQFQGRMDLTTGILHDTIDGPGLNGIQSAGGQQAAVSGTATSGGPTGAPGAILSTPDNVPALEVEMSNVEHLARHARLEEGQSEAARGGKSQGAIPSYAILDSTAHASTEFAAPIRDRSRSHGLFESMIHQRTGGSYPALSTAAHGRAQDWQKLNMAVEGGCRKSVSEGFACPAKGKRADVSSVSTVHAEKSSPRLKASPRYEGFAAAVGSSVRQGLLAPSFVATKAYGLASAGVSGKESMLSRPANVQTAVVPCSAQSRSGRRRSSPSAVPASIGPSPLNSVDEKADLSTFWNSDSRASCPYDYLHSPRATLAYDPSRHIESGIGDGDLSMKQTAARGVSPASTAGAAPGRPSPWLESALAESMVRSGYKGNNSIYGSIPEAGVRIREHVSTVASNHSSRQDSVSSVNHNDSGDGLPVVESTSAPGPVTVSSTSSCLAPGVPRSPRPCDSTNSTAPSTTLPRASSIPSGPLDRMTCAPACALSFARTSPSDSAAERSLARTILHSMSKHAPSAASPTSPVALATSEEFPEANVTGQIVASGPAKNVDGGGVSREVVKADELRASSFSGVNLNGSPPLDSEKRKKHDGIVFAERAKVQRRSAASSACGATERSGRAGDWKQAFMRRGATNAMILHAQSRADRATRYSDDELSELFLTAGDAMISNPSLSKTKGSGSALPHDALFPEHERSEEQPEEGPPDAADDTR